MKKHVRPKSIIIILVILVSPIIICLLWSEIDYYYQLREKSKEELLSSTYYSWKPSVTRIKNEQDELKTIRNEFVWKNKRYCVIDFASLSTEEISSLFISVDSVHINTVKNEEDVYLQRIEECPLDGESYYLLESTMDPGIILLIPRANLRKPAKPFAYCIKQK